MIVTTISEKYINSISLPNRIKGQFWLYETVGESEEKLVSIEGINEEWVMKSTRTAKIVDSRNNPTKSVVISAQNIYVLSKQNGEKIYVFVEPITEERQIFSKYIVRDDVTITIGRTEKNDICYFNNAVSSQHATLRFEYGRWFVQDDNSTNGIFVNGERVDRKELNIGDTVFIMGLKIIVGKNIVAFNNPDNQVKISSKLVPFMKQLPEVSEDEYEYELTEKEYFYRSPRFKRDIETAVFKVDSPPSSPVSEEMPWVLVMGSSMAMGMMSMFTLVTAIVNRNITSIVMGGSMLIGTVLLPVITKSYEKKRKHKKEAKRQRKYREYLDRIAVQINEECKLQEEILHENSATIEDCESRIKETKRNLWERGIGQNDFLRVRVGIGEGTLNAEMRYSERKFSLDDDNLQEELLLLCEKQKPLHNIPITYSLFDNLISGVIGHSSSVEEFAKGMIIQLAALYSYDEVKFVFIYDKNDKGYDFVKWLPHVWSEDDKFRFVATDVNETKEVSAYLEKVIDTRERLNANELADVSPYYIIFSMSKTLAGRAEMIKKILGLKNNIYISLVTFYDELRSLPKECTMVVELDGESGCLFDKNDISGKSMRFTPDINLTQNPLELSIALANTSLDTAASGFKLPDKITFLELFGVGKVEHLNALTRWKENDPTKSLEAAIGVDTYGETFMLDLHEKFHGPHGLVAGMTGSGKSEFIISYILSLAVNYHPNEVAFILVDYKGGGMAKSFEKLPHTAGIITNLDGAAIKRSLISIESELKRRQSIFAEASKKVGVSNIDIYKYQKLFREGVVKEPLQHLFIISDEFAELKTQQPEFMTQLVSAARIGRSLGIHLILATQKPSGVVDDQIWSNSKFRVCLKVQERADSMDMLKRPDAAELTDTGRFYLQVGYNELFELGQSAWAGAPYYPSDRVVKEKDTSIAVVDMNGHVIKQLKIDKKRSDNQNAKKQLDVITEYLRSIADEEGIKVKPLWLEPIPEIILIDDIREKYAVVSKPFVLEPVIGEYDEPVRQRQCVLRLPISQDGNVIVYGAAGSGKTTFLNAMIYSLIKEHTPDEVNLYLMDFASETLRAYSKAPHVGDVIYSYEAEKIANLFKMLQQEVSERKKLFADYGGDFNSYIKTSGKTVPSIVVVISNFAAFIEMYEAKEEAVSYLSREGTKYGIYFVLTALGVGAVRFRMLQNFRQLLVLQLNDESDYSSVVGKTDGLFPSKYKGRGLIKRDEIFEFQIASLIENEVPFGYIQTFCKEYADTWKGESARKIPILPKFVNDEFLLDYLDEKKGLNIPIGVEKNSLNVHYYPFGSSYINMVMSAGDEAKKFVVNLAGLMDKMSGIKCQFFDLPKLVETKLDSIRVYSTVKECEEQISKLFEMVLYRNNTYKDAIEMGKEIEKFDNLFIIINSITMLKDNLSDQGREKLSLILEKGSVNYNINIVIAEVAKNISTVSYEKWYKTNVSAIDGIWIGNGITEQYYLKASKNTREMHEDISQEFGYSLIKGKSVKVKVLSNTMEEDNDDEQ
ncbi:MAG: type VII secretion protein EssC [Lachnospiraceae bacterium]|nr:type VII secretion protein EssC [Lachnospiraceae bacterium]